MKILLAIDGSRCSDEAIDETGRRPWPEGSTIKVLTAFELPLPTNPEAWTMPPSYLDELDRVARTHAQEIVDHAIEKLKSKLGTALVITGEALPGSPRTTVLDVAEEWGANLIILGSHGYRAWERFLLGSVSQSVVSHAKCSVEVVHCPQLKPAGTEPSSPVAIGQ